MLIQDFPIILLDYLLLIFRGLLNLDNSSLFFKYEANVFSYYLDLLFTFLMVSFVTQINLLVFIMVSNSYVLFKKNFPTQGYILEAE